jgi:4-oxalocrotonate tautomerase
MDGSISENNQRLSWKVCQIG